MNIFEEVASKPTLLGKFLANLSSDRPSDTLLELRFEPISLSCVERILYRRAQHISMHLNCSKLNKPLTLK